MQIIDIYLTAYGGATVWFADNQALQGSLIHTLKVIHIDDHFFFAILVHFVLIIGSQNKGFAIIFTQTNAFKTRKYVRRDFLEFPEFGRRSKRR